LKPIFLSTPQLTLWGHIRPDFHPPEVRPDNSVMKTLRLKEGKERSLLRRHPWIFDSAIAKGGADAGETVRVESHAGEFLAWAAFSPASKIRARAWSFDEGQRIDAAFLASACQRAVRARAGSISRATACAWCMANPTACRV
jgi:23S rRNA G2069 N7-methylase RlmK/C1962 C5-methylase RlmI